MKKGIFILLCVVLFLNSCCSQLALKIESHKLSISSLYKLQGVYIFRPREFPADAHILVVTPEIHSNHGATFSLVYIQREFLLGGSRVKCYHKVRLNGLSFVDTFGDEIAKYSDDSLNIIVMENVMDTDNETFWPARFTKINKQLTNF